MNIIIPKSVIVIVAHPDDETLWAGGTILNHPENKWFIVCLCRAKDAERAPRFYNALKLLNTEGIMGNLDDGPDQHPLKEEEIENEILKLIPPTHFDLILTHNSKGEYTRHLRHEEINKAVVSLWHNGKISANELRTFAYEDGNKSYLPKAIESASIFEILSDTIWQRKYNLITMTYGFNEDSWEAKTTPTAEAFWQYKDVRNTHKFVGVFDNDIKMSKLSIFKLLYNNHFVNPPKIQIRSKQKIASFKSFMNLKNPKTMKNRIAKEIGLNLFEIPSVETLKSLYYKSKAYLIETNFENETAVIFKASKQLSELPIVRKSFKKIEDSLEIFKISTIEMLKSAYFEVTLNSINKK